MRENSIGKFLDTFDVNTKAYNVLLFILGILIIATLFVNQRFRAKREIIFDFKTESSIFP
jgi:hypothetical protein